MKENQVISTALTVLQGLLHVAQAKEHGYVTKDTDYEFRRGEYLVLCRCL
jgi:hypothetical protein